MKRSVLAAMIAMALLLVACGGGGDDKSSSGGSSGPFAPRDKAAAAIKGQEITVLLPYKVPKSFLAAFTAETGVKVDLTSPAGTRSAFKLDRWRTRPRPTRRRDGVRLVVDRPVRAPPAGTSRCEKALDPALLARHEKATTPSHRGRPQFAACYSNDFRMSLYNEKLFEVAGLRAVPGDLRRPRRRPREAQVDGRPVPALDPAGGDRGYGVTPWYLLTLAMRRPALRRELQAPAFASRFGRLQGAAVQVDAVENGFVSPGSRVADTARRSTSSTPGARGQFVGGPDNLSCPTTRRNPRSSLKAQFLLVPGVERAREHVRTPRGARHPERPRRTRTRRWRSSSCGMRAQTPCWLLQGVDRDAAVQHRRRGRHGRQAARWWAATSINEQLQHVAALFPQGAPKWYATSRRRRQGLLNAAVQGRHERRDALNQLADKATELQPRAARWRGSTTRRRGSRAASGS